jgi:hypothetical protein
MHRNPAIFIVTENFVIAIANFPADTNIKTRNYRNFIKLIKNLS